MKKLIGLFIMIAMMASAVPVHAWPMFSKPEYRGRVICDGIFSGPDR